MIVPFRHVATPGELDAAERAEIWEMLDRSLAAIEGALGAHGHNVGFNLGAAAGAGIADHLHLHVVPRWSGRLQLHAGARRHPRDAAVPRRNARRARRGVALLATASLPLGA